MGYIPPTEKPPADQMGAANSTQDWPRLPEIIFLSIGKELDLLFGPNGVR